MEKGVILARPGELRTLLDQLSAIFDLVRLTDPESLAYYSIDSRGELVRQEGSCFELFGHRKRCEYCTGLAACHTGRRQSKLEPMADGNSLVLSSPVLVRLDDGSEVKLVLEAFFADTERLSNDLPRSARPCGRVILDPLTGAESRLCFEERSFVTCVDCAVVFIMTDIRDFKSINDTYGHPVGDIALKLTVAVMKKVLRVTDVVIRMGGDEFLIVLFHCDRDGAARVIEKIRSGLLTGAVYDQEHGLSTYVNAGVSYRENFDGTERTCQEMYAEADREMYLEKNGE